jgi:glutamate-1-semialdehyde 2,1-aminomutase
MLRLSRSKEVFERNRRFIPGGASSLNRVVPPEIAFNKARGSRIWDVDGNEYIDYHAAFAPHLLGYACAEVVAAVRDVLDESIELVGSGTTELEGEVAELLCLNIPFLDKVAFLNTGSEATAQAIRLARSFTGRNHLIVMQGGYNGWHNDVACNLLTPLSEVGPRRVGDEYRFIPISAGIPPEHRSLVHVVNFNDLESVEAVCRRYPVGAMITEPVLQNIGVVKPLPGYLAGLRDLARQHGFALIFDEVKTGFRNGFGGYAATAGVEPDLVVYGKAVASGYPLAVLGGRDEIMRLFEPSAQKARVLLAGTYNAHPIVMAAARATMKLLLDPARAIYAYLEALSTEFEAGLSEALGEFGRPVTVTRMGSAFGYYFMDHEPRDWHDILEHHDMAADEALRRRLVECGIYWFPLATKQISLSAAHTREDIRVTLERVTEVVERMTRETVALSPRSSPHS